MASPVKDRYGDRFIPSRSGNNWETNFNMISVRERFSSLKEEVFLFLSKTTVNGYCRDLFKGVHDLARR